MKKAIWLILIEVGTLLSCKNQTGRLNKTSAEAPLMHFYKDSYNFGQIKTGDKIAHEYAFTNTGKSPLIISSVTTGCGCTVVQYPKYPIIPGKSGKIKVVFSSVGKLGMQYKVINIAANTDAKTEVYFSGEVVGINDLKDGR